MIETLDVVVNTHPERRRCSSCGALIAWFVSAKNRRPIPVDWSPRFDVVEAKQAEDGATITTIRGISHFGTCPNASTHRKRHDR